MGSGLNKLTACNKAGYRLITIFEDEWIHRKQIVISQLQTILGVQTNLKVAARTTTIQHISTTDKSAFLELNHIQGNGPSSINIGLMHNNQLVAVMGCFRSGSDLVLNRYATNCSVVGGFSKIVSHLIKSYTFDNLISFADRRWSEAGVYTKNGFVIDDVLPPDYSYLDTIHRQRLHKFNFRHKYLPKILGDAYNPILTEAANMSNAGWHRIYNCGLIRVVLHHPLMQSHNSLCEKSCN